MEAILQKIDKAILALSIFLLSISGFFLLFTVFYRYIIMTWLHNISQSHHAVLPLFLFLSNSLAALSETTDEIPGFILVWISFLGAYLVERENKHIRFDAFVDGLPKKIAKTITTLMQISLLLFFIMLLYYSILMINIDGSTEIESADIGQGWFWLILPISSTLMVFSIAVNIYKGFSCSSSSY